MVIEQAVLLAEADAARGSFRAKGEGLAAPIFEGIHLLLNDIRAVPYAPGKQRRRLHEGHANVRVTVAGQHRLQSIFDPKAHSAGVGQDIGHAPDRLDFGHELSF